MANQMANNSEKHSSHSLGLVIEARSVSFFYFLGFKDFLFSSCESSTNSEVLMAYRPCRSFPSNRPTSYSNSITIKVPFLSIF